MTTAAIDPVRDHNKRPRRLCEEPENESILPGEYRPSRPSGRGLYAGGSRHTDGSGLAALDPADLNLQADVYVWDRRRPFATPVLVSGAEQPPDDFDPSQGPLSPSLSGDASVVAFVTDDPNILLGDTPGDSVVVTEADCSRLPVDDIPGAPPGAADIRRNFQPDPSFDTFQQADADIPLNFALRNTIDRPGDQGLVQGVSVCRQDIRHRSGRPPDQAGYARRPAAADLRAQNSGR